MLKADLVKELTGWDSTYLGIVCSSAEAFAAQEERYNKTPKGIAEAEEEVRLRAQADGDGRGGCFEAQADG